MTQRPASNLTGAKAKPDPKPAGTKPPGSTVERKPLVPRAEPKPPAETKPKPRLTTAKSTDSKVNKQKQNVEQKNFDFNLQSTVHCYEDNIFRSFGSVSEFFFFKSQTLVVCISHHNSSNPLHLSQISIGKLGRTTGMFLATF